jgi:hypothetical protein
VPIPFRHGLAAPVRPVLGRPEHLRKDGWLNKRGTLRRSCRVVRPKFYGEGDLVAEGGSLIMAWEVPSVGAVQPGSPIVVGRNLAL